MTMMQVKIFEHVIQVGERAAALRDIEEQINHWLEENSDVKVVALRLQVEAIPVYEGPTNVVALCLLLYEAR